MELEYSYSILKYRHDITAGEMLNFGIVIYSPTYGQVGLLVSSRYGRFSEAFTGFDGEQYRLLMARLQTAIETIGTRLTSGLFQVEERKKYTDVASIMRSVWPDQGLGYFCGTPMFGLTMNIDQELKELYDRFVLSQYDKQDISQRINDTDLWNKLRKVLSPKGIESHLHTKLLGNAEVQFDHAYLNSKWHVIEPVSLDYTNTTEMKNKALYLFGKACAVKDVEELGSFTVIIGRPKRIEEGKAYNDAMNLIRRIPIDHKEIVFEDQLESFALQLEREMREHGIIPAEQDSTTTVSIS